MGDGALIEAPHEDLDFLRTTSFGLLQVRGRGKGWGAAGLGVGKARMSGSIWWRGGGMGAGDGERDDGSATSGNGLAGFIQGGWFCSCGLT